MIKGFLPGGLRHTSEVFGVSNTFKLMFGTVFSYKRTVIYFIKKRKFRALWNFFYVKTLVPVGEGAGGAFYILFGGLIRHYPSLAPFPRYIELEVTTVCDKKCIFCEHTYWNEKSRHLTFEEFKHIINQFPDLKWTNLTGEGTAFLNKDYIRMIEYLKQKDIPVYLVDHFNMVDDTIAKKLIQLGVDGIYISLDAATKKTYEEIKVGCDFNIVVDNIKNFIRIKKELRTPIPELCFRYVITTKNINEMSQFVNLISSFGDKSDLGDGSRIEFCGLLEFDAIKDYKVHNVPESLTQNILQTANEKNQRVMFCHSEPKTHPPLEHCLAWMEPYIMMGGYVLPCCSVLMSNKRDFLREKSFGNVFKQSFKDIWNSERYKNFRHLVNKKEGVVPLLCKDCRAYNTIEREEKYGVDLEL